MAKISNPKVQLFPAGQFIKARVTTTSHYFELATQPTRWEVYEVSGDGCGTLRDRETIEWLNQAIR